MDILNIDKKEFADFAALGIGLFQDNSSDISNDSSLPKPHWNTNTSLVEELKKHVIYNLLINDPLFQKALEKFKKTPFFIHFSKIYGALFEEEMPIWLMQIFSPSAHMFLCEQELWPHGLVNIVNRDEYLSQLQEVEKTIDTISSKFLAYSSKDLKAELLKLQKHIGSETPCLYAEKLSGYFCERMLVQRICNHYYDIFKHISRPVISRLSKILFKRSNIPIPDELIKKWLQSSEHEFNIATNLPGSIFSN